MPEVKPDILLADQPLEDTKDDCLGYASFAKQVAQIISRMPAEGLVMAIRGDWGMGKSTVLNFIERCLRESAGENPPIIVRFNPWWFTGREDLILQFFDSLQDGLGVGGTEMEGLRSSLAHFAGLVSKLPLPYLKEAGEATQMLLQPGRKSVLKLKDEIADTLRHWEMRVIVIIDDVDRLDKEEIRLLFSVIKGVADFPNVCYLLAFDWQVVVNALNGMQTEDGEDYLQKIVQLPIAVRQPTNTALHAFYIKNIQPLKEKARSELQENDTLSSELEVAVMSFIETPRDVVRLFNSVVAFYEQVKDEAFFTDYLVASALNVFCPLAYDMVARFPEKFEMDIGIQIEGPLKSELKGFHGRWLKSIRAKDRGRLIRLLGAMYPQLQSVLEGIDLGES